MYFSVLYITLAHVIMDMKKVSGTTYCIELSTSECVCVQNHS